jgi:hypothetical protein
MDLVLHTNCGFVTTAPTSDPEETALVCDTIARALKMSPRLLLLKLQKWGGGVIMQLKKLILK